MLGGRSVCAGATKQETAEAIGVTFLMNGGPATIYGPRAYDAFCEFADADIRRYARRHTSAITSKQVDEHRLRCSVSLAR